MSERSTTRLLALFPGALGDLCLLAPALAAMLAEGTRVELSVQRSLVSVARVLLPTADIGLAIDGASMSSLFTATIDPALLERLRGVDHVHAWLGRTADAGALAERFRAIGVRASLHAVPREDGPRHASLDYATMLSRPEPLRPLRVAGTPESSLQLPWRGPADARLLLHPGAGALRKRWAREGFERVADAWRARGGEALVLLGPAEEDQTAAWQRSGHALVAGCTLADALCVVVSASWWLGNDSGMSHVAGVLDRRGVVLFGPTRAARWRPLGRGLAVVDFAGRASDAVARDVSAHLEPDLRGAVS